MITELGELSVGAINFKLLAALQILLGVSTDLQAQLNANLAVDADLPHFDLAGAIAALQEILNELIAGLIPKVGISADINAALIAKIGLIAPFIDLNGRLAAAGPGVYAYAYDGQVSAFGSEFSAKFAGGLPGGLPIQHANGLVFMMTDQTVFALFSEVIKATP